MKSPVGTLSDRTVLRKQDGGALPRQVPRLPGRMRPPRFCCGIKHTKSENLPPYAPQSSDFDLLSLFSPGACLLFPGGCRAATRPSGREISQDAPKEGAYNPAMRPIKSTQEGTLQQGSVALKFSEASLLYALQRCCQPFEMLERSVWFRARRARKFKFSHFFGLLLRVRSGRPLHICQPTGVQLNRSCAGSGEVQRRHAYDECPQKFR